MLDFGEFGHFCKISREHAICLRVKSYSKVKSSKANAFPQLSLSQPSQPGLSYIAFLSTIQYQYNTSKYWDNTIQYQYNTISIKIVYNTLSSHTIYHNMYIILYCFNAKLSIRNDYDLIVY